jgi:holo-[acyl-carrier protein] synthase
VKRSPVIIIGTGIDLVSCARIHDSWKRFGDKFLNRIFMPGEIAYALKSKYPERHLAARFAAKEAASKAFGTGIGKDLGWQDMEVMRHTSGQPHLLLHGKALELAARLGASGSHLSLTHADDYAAAQVLLTGDPS